MQLKKYNDYLVNEDLAMAITAIAFLHESYMSKSQRRTHQPRLSNGHKPSGIFGRLLNDLGLTGGKFVGSLVNQFKKSGSNALQDIFTKYAPEAWEKISNKVLGKKDLIEISDVFQSLLDKMTYEEKNKFKKELEKIANTLDDAGDAAGARINIKL